MFQTIKSNKIMKSLVLLVSCAQEDELTPSEVSLEEAVCLFKDSPEFKSYINYQHETASLILDHIKALDSDERINNLQKANDLINNSEELTNWEIAKLTGFSNEYS